MSSPASLSLKEECLKLPNLLTLSRIILILPIVLLMLENTSLSNLFALLLFAIASFTDWLDGFVARRQKLVSTMGKFLDPLADKLLVQAILILCVELGRVPGWFVILLLSREIAVTGLRAIAASEGLQLDVVWWGKFKTAFQMVALVFLMLHESFQVELFSKQLTLNMNSIGLFILAISMAFSLLSAAAYFRRFAKAAYPPTTSKEE